MISKTKPPEIPIAYLITLIAKYYYHNCSSYTELTDMVQSKLSEFQLSGYQEYRFHTKIENICKGLFESGDVGFKELDYIPVYEHELEVVNSLDTEHKKKLMFTFFVLARYMDSDGWINKKTSKGISEAFRLANVTVSTDIKNAILHELYRDKYISFAKRIDNMNIRVKSDGSGEIVYKVRDFKNLGNQYIGHFKKGYRQCEVCGRVIRATNNRRKYCRKCSEQKRIEWMRNKRNAEKAQNG